MNITCKKYNKLDEKGVLEIVGYLQSGLSNIKILSIMINKYEITGSCISKIRHRKTWNNVTKDLIFPETCKNKNITLDEHGVIFIAEYLMLGTMTMDEIIYNMDNKHDYGITPDMVTFVKNKTSWNHLIGNYEFPI